ncbi:inositol-pentakisphosphate 2-kinase-like isoform X1 [Daktulosphaira vitifoliae]|uniref:inositol-pentakisphosphate 2-kinase-like isoform X1 n=1 Tax=Daktulosphaira vitifoliae TaxID=58002 RepID=UPI0021A9D318|nr:inositol-pentakisphosphate 2-kinase-like isoform X1 [Daktulosphaira vitifoliae]
MNTMADFNDHIKSIDLKQKKWFYKGEGNANLVLSIPEDSIVLRILKVENDKVDIETVKSILMNAICFYEVITSLFFHKQYIKIPELMIIKNKSISEINKDLKTFRPKIRLHKNIGSLLVAVYPDYTLSLPKITSLNETHYKEPIYCVEIKPKQGWIIDSEKVNSKCFFCMNQYLKFVEKTINTFSCYCPMELFSGNVERMKEAIKNLLLTPQNNLKLFKNGLPITNNYLESSLDDVFENVDEFSMLIVMSLIKEFKYFIKHNYTIITQAENLNNCKEIHKTDLEITAHNIKFSGKGCNFNYTNLPENCVLNYILSMQKLQSIDFTSIYSEYKENANELTDYYYVEQLNSKIKNSNFLNLDLFERYLLATTARDCSIYVTFRKLNSFQLNQTNQDYLIDINNKYYFININVGDLDPKPLSCIKKHYKRNINILKAYIHYYKN